MEYSKDDVYSMIEGLKSTHDVQGHYCNQSPYWSCSAALEDQGADLSEDFK